MSLRLTLIQKGDLCPSWLLSLITGFSVFCAPSRRNPREQLVRGRFFEGLQNGNENKIILGDFKMDRDGGNKTQILYRSRSKEPGYKGSTLI